MSQSLTSSKDANKESDETVCSNQEETQVSPPQRHDSTNSSTFLSQLFLLRRGHNVAVSTPDCSNDEESDLSILDWQADCETKKSQDPAHPSDNQENKTLCLASVQEPGRCRNPSDPTTTSRRESRPGAFSIPGIAPPSLSRYHSGGSHPDEILVQASVVSPSPPIQQVNPPNLVEASPMPSTPSNVVMIDKSRLRIIIALAFLLLLGLAIGLGVSFGRKANNSNEHIRNVRPANLPPPNHCRLRRGGGGCLDQYGLRPSYNGP